MNPSQLQPDVDASQMPTQAPQQQQSLWNGLINVIRPFAGQAAGSLAATGTALIPGVGETGVAEGLANTQGYALVDGILQKLRTGDQNPTWGEAFGEGEKQALINAVGGKIIGGLFRGAQALRSADTPEIYKFLPTTSQALEAHGMHILGTSAKLAEDIGASGAKTAALDRAGGAGFTQALRFVNLLNGRMAGINSDPSKIADNLKFALTDGIEPAENPSNYKSWSPQFRKSPAGQPQYTISQDVADTFRNGKNTFQVLDDALAPGNADKLSKILVAGQANGQVGLNVKQDLQAYQFMKMIQDGAKYDSSGAFVRFNPDQIKKVWNNTDMQQSLQVLYGKDGKKNVTDFLQNIFNTQDKVLGSGTTAGYMRNRALWAATGGFMLGSELLHNLTGTLAGLGGITGMYVGANTIGRALTNPKVARTLVALAGGEPLSEGKQFLTKQLMDSLQGASLAIVDSKGVKHPGRVETDSQTGQLKWVND